MDAPEAGPSGTTYTALDDDFELSDGEEDQLAVEHLEDESDDDSASSSGSSSGSSSASSTHLDEYAAGGGSSSIAQGKKPAWTDPDDGGMEIDIAADSRLRKLRRTADEEVVGGRDYEVRLRAQYV
jgi:U3 small nucleolar RNA-associated protein 18